MERVTWALQDPVAAQALADAPPVSEEGEFPKIDQWLDVFAQNGLLSSSVADLDPHSTNQNGSVVHLVDSGASSQNPPNMDSVRFQLARWMSCHLHVPQLLAWVLRNGGHMHPVLRREVQRKLADADVEIPPKLRHLWCILLDSDSADPWRFVWIAEQLRASSDSLQDRRCQSWRSKRKEPPGESRYEEEKECPCGGALKSRLSRALLHASSFVRPFFKVTLPSGLL